MMAGNPLQAKHAPMPPTLTAYVPLPPAVCSPPAGPGSPAASAPALCRTSYAAADGKGMPSATKESPARNPVELMTVPLSEEVEGPALQQTDPGVCPSTQHSDEAHTSMACPFCRLPVLYLSNILTDSRLND